MLPSFKGKKALVDLALKSGLDEYRFVAFDVDDQGKIILSNPLHILLIAVPLVLQTVLIFFVAYGWAKWWKLPHEIAAPAGMIGASNFFELAVAVAISLFGLQSGAALVTVVGVLVEVPVMLALVRVANGTRAWFPKSNL